MTKNKSSRSAEAPGSKFSRDVEKAGVAHEAFERSIATVSTWLLFAPAGSSGRSAKLNASETAASNGMPKYREKVMAKVSAEGCLLLSG